MQFRLYNIAVSIILLTIISCDRKGLDYDKIDFEVRKRSITYGIENPSLERKSETNRPLYLHYEDEINKHKKDLFVIYNLLDSLQGYKDIWLDTIKIRQAQRIKNKDNFANSNRTPELEYDNLIKNYRETIRIYSQRLESENQLYEDVSKITIYYEFVYEISGKTTWDDKEVVLEARVRADEGSNVFECLFLDSHLFGN